MLQLPGVASLYPFFLEEWVITSVKLPIMALTDRVEPKSFDSY